MTNADKILNMTDEELTRFLNGIVVRCIDNTGCTGCPMREGCCYEYDWMEKWMKQEAVEQTTEQAKHIECDPKRGWLWEDDNGKET